MLSFIKKFGLALALILLLTIVFQNLEPFSQTVKFHLDLYYVFLESPELPVFAYFAVFFLFGMLAAGLQGLYVSVTRMLEIRRRDRRIRELEKELASLKPSPESEASTSGSGPAVETGTGAYLEDQPTL